MLFNSLAFLGFLVAVVGFHSLPLPWVVRKFNLLVASYVFYAAWNPWFTLLLVFATLTNWTAARVISKWDTFPGRRSAVLWLDVVLNIGLLSAFKYGNELLGVAQWVAGPWGLSLETTRNTILLPVGLSFFTFQALSYTIDVYRRTITPAKSLLDFGLFVSFFPVLLAGPLLRAGAFLPQCEQPRRAAQELSLAATLITLGLFVKIAVADFLLAPVVRQVFDHTTHADTLSSWIGILAFAGQDYCDFAGYATCAMGVGVSLGFSLPENFRAPFASVGFRDLWQRWHITLVAWMRDYVFLSLGGVYKGYRRAAVNVMIVFLLIGLWHGAATTYVIFGLLHGVYLIVETMLQRSPIRRLQLWNTSIGTFSLWLATMLLCCVAFVFYRSETIEQSWSVLSAMAGMVHTSHPVVLADFDVVATAIVIECLVIAHWLRRNLSVIEVIDSIPWWITSLCLGLMLLAILATSGESQSFLYFRY